MVTIWFIVRMFFEWFVLYPVPVDLYPQTSYQVRAYLAQAYQVPGIL